MLMETRASTFIHKKVSGNLRQNEWKALGKHIILELFTKDVDKLDDASFIKQMLIKAAEEAETAVLNYADYKFKPQGLTAVVLLAESHISVHTWPEYGYVAVDIYTCGGIPEKAMNFIIKKLNAYDYDMNVIIRGRYNIIEEKLKNNF